MICELEKERKVGILVKAVGSKHNVYNLKE